MKSVLISIQPKWVEKIAIGQKTIEVRKSKPKLETPFKCYIYQTKSKDNAIYKQYKVNDMRSGKVIGEFVCDRIDTYLYDQEFDESMGVYLNNYGYDITSHELGQTCLSYKEFEKYGNTNMLYGWNITNLKIYDKPKELSEFYSAKWDMPCDHKKRGFNMDFCMAYENGSHFCKECICDKKRLARPPQSWCYVESLGE